MALFPSLKRAWAPSDDRWYKVISPPTTAGVSVDEQESMKYTTLAACVTLISGDVARLPLILYKRNKDGSKERIENHPLYSLLHDQPNPETDSYRWREASQLHLLLWGNTYHEKQFNGTGDLIGLYPLNPEFVKVERRNGRIVYVWQDSSHKEVVRTQDKIFHVANIGYNGITGLSPVTLAKESIGLGLAEQEYQARFIGKGTHPAGVLEMDGYLSEKSAKQFKDSFKQQYEGLGKSHSIMVLEGGLKYKGLSMNHNDAQFLESRNFQKLEICGFFRVPPHKVGIHGANSNYNNLEQENQSYVDSCLSHWIKRWETAINNQLLTQKQQAEGLYFKFLLQALLRGDMQARSEYNQKMWQMGMPFNRILEKEDENPVPGGDIGFVPLNMVPADMAKDIAKVQAEPPKPVKEEPEELPNEKKFLIAQQETLRISYNTEQRGIVMRDRVARAYYPLFVQAAQTIVNRESVVVKKKVNQRAISEDWLKDFYNTMPDYIRAKFGPTFRSFASAIKDAAQAEIGGDPVDTDKWVNDYIERYIQRHVESSEGQLTALLAEGDDSIITRVDEWAEKRPDKIAMNETVRMSNGMFQVVAFAAGFSTVWRIRGADTCPYCQELNGRRVVSGQSFVDSGDEVAPKGQKPMPVRGLKAHPPLHQGCDCYLGV